MFKFKRRLHLATKILIGMAGGVLVGLLIKSLPATFAKSALINDYLVNGLFDIIGQWFIAALRMLVVPIIFVSLVCGIANYNSDKSLGRISLKTVSLFLFLTLIAILIGLSLALFFHVGTSKTLVLYSQLPIPPPHSIKQILLDLVPNNLIQTMGSVNSLPLIVFSLLFGIAISIAGKAGKPIVEIFEATKHILIKLIELIIKAAPYGVFCLMVMAITQMGLDLLSNLLFYSLALMIGLIIQNFVVYPILLIVLARLNPLIFFRKMIPAMIFAFSSASSSASIPILLETAEKKLGVENLIASFTVALGTTIHKSGSAIMQVIAAIFIANIYHISLSLSAYFVIMLTTILAAFSTAGGPSICIFTLAIVLQQAGLPLEGIGLLIGVDRLLDMMRTVVNVSGVMVTACIVAKSEKSIDRKTYQQMPD